MRIFKDASYLSDLGRCCGTDIGSCSPWTQAAKGVMPASAGGRTPAISSGTRGRRVSAFPALAPRRPRGLGDPIMVMESALPGDLW